MQWVIKECWYFMTGCCIFVVPGGENRNDLFLPAENENERLFQ